jgi:hypothetical protein
MTYPLVVHATLNRRCRLAGISWTSAYRLTTFVECGPVVSWERWATFVECGPVVVVV